MDAQLPDDIEALKALIAAGRAENARLASEKRAAEDLIAHLRLQILKLRRAQFGQSSERQAHLIEQLELELADLESDCAESAARREAASPKNETVVPAHTRRKPTRALPEHLPRERHVLPPPTACSCCGSDKLSKLGEDVTETLEVVPRRWFVKQTVRERWSCRACEKISQPPAPFHAIARGRAGPSLLAMILWSKYAMHLPLHRQSTAYAREGVDLDVSTLADWVGAAAAALAPLTEAIRAHVFSAERLHADDTTVPVQARGRTRTGRLWTYVRDDRPFAGGAPPAAVYFYSRDRAGAHCQEHLQNWSGLLQADAFAGFNPLYTEDRAAGAILGAACWSHARRKFFELAAIGKKEKDARAAGSPIAFEAVKRIDLVFAAERDINGAARGRRLAVRKEIVAALVLDLHQWMTAERARVSAKGLLAKAMDYMLKRWSAFTRFLDDGRLCLSNNAAERAVRGVALGRKNWTFAGSDRGGERAAAIYTLIETAKLCDIDPHAWLADVLARIADTPSNRLGQLLPWNWRSPASPRAQAA